MARSKRNRPSSIDRLPAEAKATIGELIAENRLHIDEMLDHIRGLGYHVSRSALGRHKKSLDEISADLRRAREMATALTRDLDPNDKGKTAELVIELLESGLVRALTTADENGDLVLTDSKNRMMDSITVKNTVGTRQAIDKIRTVAKAEQKKESAETAKGAAVAAGLSRETVDQIYHAVLGVAA